MDAAALRCDARSSDPRTQEDTMNDSTSERPDEPKRLEEETAETSEPAGETQRPRRLLRSRSDRMIAGVAGGLGRYFAVDPVIFRIAFAISVFFGGLGLLAYIALALFVPSEAADGTIEEPAVQRSRGL